MEKGDDWKIGISGLQPESSKAVSSDETLTKLTDVKLNNDKTVLEQFNAQLLRLILKQHKSASRFFEDAETGYMNYDSTDN